MARSSIIALLAALLTFAPGAVMAQETAQPVPAPTATAPAQQVPILRGQYSLPPGETESGPPVQGPSLPGAPTTRPVAQPTAQPTPTPQPAPTATPSARTVQAVPTQAPRGTAATRPGPVRQEEPRRVQQPTSDLPQVEVQPTPEVMPPARQESVPLPSLSDEPTQELTAEESEAGWGRWPWVLLGLLLAAGALLGAKFFWQRREEALVVEKIEPYRPPPANPAPEPVPEPGAVPAPRPEPVAAGPVLANIPPAASPAAANTGGFVTSSIPSTGRRPPPQASSGFVTTPVRQVTPDGRITTSLPRRGPRSS